MKCIFPKRKLSKSFNFKPQSHLKITQSSKLNGFDSWGTKVRQNQKLRGQDGLKQVL
jgi:hypothetical protein